MFHKELFPVLWTRKEGGGEGTGEGDAKGQKEEERQRDLHIPQGALS